MLLIKSPDRAPQLFSSPALLTEVCGDAALPSSSYCGVSVMCAQLCLPAVHITWIFFGFSVLLYNKATAQLQECEKCKKPGGRLAGSGVCCECVRGWAVLHRQLLQNITVWSLPRKIMF